MSYTKHGQQNGFSPMKVISKLFFSLLGVVFILIGIMMFLAQSALAQYEDMLVAMNLWDMYQASADKFTLYAIVFLVVGFPLYIVSVLSSARDY